MTIKIGNSEVENIAIIEPYSDADVGGTDWDERSIHEDWVRPDDWLDMPVYGTGDSKAAILIAIESGNAPQKVGIYTRGDSANGYKTHTTINWGDGSSELLYSQGMPPTHVYHEYSYEDIPESSEFIFNGRTARQVILELDGSVSGIDYVNLERLNGYDGSLNANNHYSNALEVVINAPELTIIYNGSAKNKNIEKFTVYCDNYIDTYSPVFANLNNLRVAVMNSGATSSRTSMRNFFIGCNKLQQAPFLDTSSATSMNNLFNSCYSLRSVPNYDSSNVTDFFGCFWNCRSLDYVPDWDYSNATTLSHTFGNMHDLKAVPNGLTWPTGQFDLYNTFLSNTEMVYFANDFNFSGVTNFRSAFESCKKLKSVPSIYAPNATGMHQAFYNCESITNLDLKDISSVTTMNSAIRNCYELREVTGENLPTGCTNFYTLFYQNYKMVKAPVFDTSHATDVSHMYGFCNNLEEAQTIDLSSSNGSIRYIFADCFKIKDARFININNKLTDAVFAFKSCYSLQSIPSGLFEDYNSAPSLKSYMFQKCNFSHIRDISLSGCIGTDRSPFYTESENIRSFGNIEFGSGAYLDYFMLNQKYITYIPDWDISNVVNMSNGFYGCSSLSWSDIQGARVNIGYYTCNLGSGALENIFNNLGDGVTGQSIDIRNNPGTSQLHPDTIAIATSKGWTVTT